MSPFRRFSVGLVAAVVVVLASVAPASAHDELLSSSPGEDARLDVPPSSVSLTFSGDVMELGALVMVVDQADRDWTAGAPAIEWDTLTVPLEEGMPVGGYEVRWRVVSSDGHPISGVIPFTVGDAEPLQRSAAASGTDASMDAGEASAPEQQSQNAQENGGVLRVVLIGLAGAAVAVSVLAAIFFLRRRRHVAGADEAVAPPSEHP